MAAAPLFRDPVHDGAADPTAIFSVRDRAWMIVYTSRRADLEGPGFAWVHGSAIGTARSPDRGRSWSYAGALAGLEIEAGLNTFWAPEIVFARGLYHMYVSYVRGTPSTWDHPRRILHYTSPDLAAWDFRSALELSSDRVIDACVHILPSGRWRMWYKDEADGSSIHAADSEDLSRWEPIGPALRDRPQEGPNVFSWRGWYWMLTDPWRGLGVYRSRDCEAWERRPEILAAPGSRPDDGNAANHADAVVDGDRAFVLYFVHPEPDLSGGRDPDAVRRSRRSSLQAAELHFADGGLLCDRDRAFDLDLGDPS